MMASYLILSDIHGNYEALEAVLEDARSRYDRILCLGDLVGYGADPNPVAEWAKSNVASIVRGNHDRACTDPEILEWFNDDAASVVRWTVEVIGQNTEDLIREEVGRLIDRRENQRQV